MQTVRKDEFEIISARHVANPQGATMTSVKPAASAVRGTAGQKARAMLRARLGDEVYTSWFNALEFDSYDDGTVQVSVPVKFLRNWIQSHYSEDLLACCQAEFKGAERVEVVLRQPGGAGRSRTPAQQDAPQAQSYEAHPVASAATNHHAAAPVFVPPTQPTRVGGFEGSPLDPRYTFDTFVVGASNRIAHAAATRVAEAVSGVSPGFNPLFIHAPVGLGKSHLLHATAWEVKRRKPDAQVLYLTAEGFRYRFVEALRSEDPLAFKEKFRQVDILLIDDLEFMHGAQTEQEFEHIINALLDGGKQVVVASARPPAHIERLNERMRSRLARGLVTELGSLDYELRLKVLEMRLAEKQAVDPTFVLAPEVLRLLAERLTDNGRELEGAVIRLFANWQYMRTQITMDIAETVIRDLVQGIEPRRIKIEDILRIISRHFGVSKGDLLSQRRHRSVVWPRQIGMYLAKQLTQRSLPEIGRRFGNRDHTTVLHAIRKIEGQLSDNPRLRDEIEELKKLLSH
ncbi:Chromosomal replication initiator protein DnaA [Candidatus Filomicrobium marinum]|uniref:Chromosomal replication initiator protein DnaA n=2 Tax=Filomicrobium TaxID=119044 RepID=A0A0D6JD82_9HYPH|nr:MULTISPECIES: chromosomal replication initiator protein DnaA [Filomicrobium]MCV0368288.1 chromosomal replication initiator protein DnaA [Filomicrobium sp.]CFX12901.1 Chromosomal replication initiator protein DnaA [Candidatus Filomicrobium marinum]CPR17520.1 Chromosomal replication initiator protein DnaA [Candidatus Filomicrobium marinum]SDO32613.1 chromosomal replication initiator protein DnaA [Filomicrobium insigne]